MTRAAVVLMTAILAACGGGGSDTNVSENPPASTPDPVTPAPEPTEPSTPAPLKPIPVMPGPVPTTPTSPSAPSVSGAAVIRALTSPVSKRALDPQGPQYGGYFSKVVHDYDAATARYISRSWLTELNNPGPVDTGEKRAVALSLASTTDGSSRFVFTGDGSITTPQGQYAISGGYVIPATVPLDTTVHEFRLPASSAHHIRFFVGSIDGKPEWMRVCMNINAPGVLRVSCSRNRRDTGEPVGVDTVNDLAGDVFGHESTDLDTKQWTVLRCVIGSWSVGGPPGGYTSYDYRSFGYDSSMPYGGLVPELPWRYGDIVVAPEGNGLQRLTVPNPQGWISYGIRDGVAVVFAEVSATGGTGGARTYCAGF